jgi:hypothetical protein
MNGRGNLYLGKAGQMHVMAEFLERGWNVGAPEVDVGDDVFVVRDEGGDLSRIQVKTARATDREYGYSAQFNVSSNQLKMTREPPLDYVFLVRREDDWGPFVVIRQTQLDELVETQRVGSRANGKLIFHVGYETDANGAVTSVECSDVELDDFVDDFSSWPRISHGA